MILQQTRQDIGALMSGLFLVLILPCSLAIARDTPDPRLREGKRIFVSGDNEAAEKIRSGMRADSVKEPGLTTGRHDGVTGTLTTKSGDPIWSRTDSFSDAPFMSGVKTSAGLVYKRLKAAACQ